MPRKAVVPITTPVKITFPDKTELWTVIDPDTGQHSVQCDLCSKNLKAGLQGSGNTITMHRNGKDCEKQVTKKKKQMALERLLVSNVLHDQLEFGSDQCMIRQGGAHQMISGW